MFCFFFKLYVFFFFLLLLYKSLENFSGTFVTILKQGWQSSLTIRSQLVFLAERETFLKYESSFDFTNVPMRIFFSGCRTSMLQAKCLHAV